MAERQARIREFVPELDLRERRALLEDIGESTLPENPLEALLDWAQRPASLHVKRLRPIAWGFAAISLLTAIAVLAFGLSAWWLIRVFVAQATFAYLIRRRTTAAFVDLEPVSRELRRIAAFLDLMPNEVTRAEIVHLRTPYRLNLRRDWMGNLMFAPLGARSACCRLTIAAWPSVSSRSSRRGWRTYIWAGSGPTAS